MWSRFGFAFVVVLGLAFAGCATVDDGPAPRHPTKAEQQAHEEEVASHMQMRAAMPPP